MTECSDYDIYIGIDHMMGNKAWPNSEWAELLDGCYAVYTELPMIAGMVC